MSENNTTAQLSWPFREAERIAERLKQKGKTEALFETGYGPSGLPHIGTFGEVARTTWVRHAFTALTGVPSRLLAFCDDMDGLRKVPDNVPNKEMLREYLGKPLTRIPDPFGTHDSFGAHNNARLRAFLDGFGFDYEFASSTDYYASGRFDAALLRVLRCTTRSSPSSCPPWARTGGRPIRPSCRSTRAPASSMQVQIEQSAMPTPAPCSGPIPADGETFETSVHGGARQAAMEGRLGDALVRARRRLRDVRQGPDRQREAVQPRSAASSAPSRRRDFTYELFLDEHGQKISKRKGNGLSVEEWLRYAPPESLASSCTTSRSAPSGCIST